MKAAVAISSLQENEYFAKKAAKLFSSVSYLESRPSSEQLRELVQEYDVLIIGARERISADLLEGESVRTQIVGTLSVGTDHLDMPALSARKITVITCPTANVRSVAEHAIAVVFALLKRLKEADLAVQRDGKRGDLAGLPVELQSKTLGLVGYGKIGSEIGRIANALGMSVLATSKTRKSGTDGDVRFATLAEVAKAADALCISVPLNDSTKHLISQSVISEMRHSAVLINTSRSAVVDEAAVLTALESSKLAGYSADTDSDELDLSKLPNVIMTPHIAGITVESNDRLDNELIDRLGAQINSEMVD